MMAPESPRGQWLLPMLAEFLGYSGEALRILNGADQADKWLLVRRAVEYDLRLSRADGISDQTFRQAAAALRGLGQPGEAAALDAIAATSSDLDDAALEWQHRYDARPLTAAERADFEALASGRIGPHASGQVIGIDGAVYAAVSLAGPEDALTPAVIVTTHAGFAEIVTGFGDEGAQEAWLADRQRGRTAPSDGLAVEAAVPIAGCVTGPGCRTQREERILAWLLQDGSARRDDIPLLEEHTFSTHTRAEIYLAWRQAAESGTAPPAAEIRHALARRLLRAPAWAATSVGWPFGQLALTYLDRLAATPVTRLQAETAAQELFREDTAAVGGHARGASATSSRTATPLQCSPGTRAAHLLPEPRRPDGPSPGPAPRI